MQQTTASSVLKHNARKNHSSWFLSRCQSSDTSYPRDPSLFVIERCVRLIRAISTRINYTRNLIIPVQIEIE